MAGRESAAMERAVADALAGVSNTEAARRHEVSRSALKLALRRRGVGPKAYAGGTPWVAPKAATPAGQAVEICAAE